MLGPYCAFGVIGILTFPVRKIYGMLPGRDKASLIWMAAFVLLLLGLLIPAVLTAITGIFAVPQHLFPAHWYPGMFTFNALSDIY